MAGTREHTGHRSKLSGSSWRGEHGSARHRAQMKWQTRLITSHDPVCSGMADRKAVIVAICYLLLSLKLKFINVTEERAIVCSSSETCLCWRPFPYSWHAGEVKSFEKSPSKVKNQTIFVIKNLPAWSNHFNWQWVSEEIHTPPPPHASFYSLHIFLLGSVVYPLCQLPQA